MINGIKLCFEFSTYLIRSAELFCFSLFSLPTPEYASLFISVSQLSLYSNIHSLVNIKLSTQKDQFCKHVSSTEYKVPVLIFSSNEPYFSCSFDKSVKSLVFCHLKPAGFLNPAGCSAECTNWLQTKTPAVMSHFLQHSAAQQSKLVQYYNSIKV